MTTYEVVLACALGLVAVALQSAFPPSKLNWWHKPARLVTVAHGVMTFALCGGLVWSEDTQRAAMMLSSWMAGSLIGLPVAAWRFTGTSSLAAPLEGVS